MRRTIALVVAVAALFTALTAQAEKTAYVKMNALKVYASASTSSEKLIKLNFGESVTYIKKKGRWAKVRLTDGQVGFCALSGLTAKNPNGKKKTYYAKSDGVEAYARTSTSSGVLAEFDQNDAVTVVAVTRDSKWYRVKLEDGYGYAKAGKLSKTKTMEPFTVYIAKNTVQFYKSASKSSKKVGVMSYGESVTCVKIDGDWAKVRNEKGKTGWCKKSRITTQNPNGSAETWYAAASAGVYAKPLTSSGKLATLDEGDDVDAVARTPDGKWMRLDLGGEYGYVKAAKLSAAKPMEPFTAYIAKNTVQFYKSASKSSKKAGVMSYGESATCIKIDGDWAKVRNDKGKTGWCKKSRITTQNPNGSAETWYAAASAGVYAKPLTSSKKLETLDEGDDVDAVARTPDDKWMRLDLGGEYGYVKAAKLTDDAPGDKDDTPAYSDANKGTAGGTVEKVIALAVDQYGKKYVYATHGPNTFDCSGLTSYCFDVAADVSLSRSAYGQGYDSRFEKIESVGALKRGDVVCFNTVQSDVDLSDHVGIYLGGGKFIHASSSAGKVVVSTLSSGYYYRQFSWGLRIVD